MEKGRGYLFGLQEMFPPIFFLQDDLQDMIQPSQNLSRTFVLNILKNRDENDNHDSESRDDFIKNDHHAVERLCRDLSTRKDMVQLQSKKNLTGMTIYLQRTSANFYIYLLLERFLNAHIFCRHIPTPSVTPSHRSQSTPIPSSARTWKCPASTLPRAPGRT